LNGRNTVSRRLAADQSTTALESAKTLQAETSNISKSGLDGGRLGAVHQHSHFIARHCCIANGLSVALSGSKIAHCPPQREQAEISDTATRVRRRPRAAAGRWATPRSCRHEGNAAGGTESSQRQYAPPRASPTHRGRGSGGRVLAAWRRDEREDTHDALCLISSFANPETNPFGLCTL
jgi:hypothetical protein